MLEAMLIDLAAGKGADLLVSAGGNIATKCKAAHHWKKVFVDTVFSSEARLTPGVIGYNIQE